LKKWFFRIFITLCAIVFATALYIYVKKDEIQQKAISGINQKLDAKIIVNGKIDITFISTFPNITLELNKVFIEDKFNEKDTLINVERINFTINPLSLLSDELSIKSIIIKDGIIKLKTFANGKSNYEIIKASSDANKNKKANLNLEEIIIVVITWQISAIFRTSSY